jgi:hypothetical protein
MRRRARCTPNPDTMSAIGRPSDFPCTQKESKVLVKWREIEEADRENGAP